MRFTHHACYYSGRRARVQPLAFQAAKKSLRVPYDLSCLQSLDRSPLYWWPPPSGCPSRRMFAYEEAAVENGEAQVLTPEKLRERIEASKAKSPAQVISLRIAEADLAMARRRAEQKGLPYQNYIKSLLHETLAERE